MDVYQQCTSVLNDSFANSGKTDLEICEKLGITTKTFYNWLDGKTFPKMPYEYLWYQALQTDPLPYIMRMPYYETNNRITSKKYTLEYYKHNIEKFRDSMQPMQIERLHYIWCESHGSSQEGLVELFNAYLHLPLSERITIASDIDLRYAIAESRNQLIMNGIAMPNKQILHESIEQAKIAVLNGYSGYTGRTAL